MNSPMPEVSVEARETARNSGVNGFQSLSPAEKGRRYYSMLLNRMGIPGTGAAVAAKLELSEATISRAKEDLERGCAVIAAIGLKVVDERKTCVDPGEIGFLRKLYDRAKTNAPWLLDEDGE